MRNTYAFSSQIMHRCRMVSTAFCISCTDTHSCLPWNACSPAKMLGQGRPMNDSREPSVPPRMLHSLAFKPARLMASMPYSTIWGCFSNTPFILRYWGLISIVRDELGYFFNTSSARLRITLSCSFNLPSSKSRDDEINNSFLYMA